MRQVPLDDLNQMDRRAFAAALGDIFEHSPWVAEIACAARPFPSVTTLYETMIIAVRDASEERQTALIRSHPDLAGKAALAGELTADCASEQATAGLDQLSKEEFTEFHRLNAAYREKFAMPFVICVRRHGKDSILRQFERRLRNDTVVEREAALNEIFRIAALRLDQLVAGPNRLKVHGRLTTHVLDNYNGVAAAKVAIEFCELAATGKTRVLSRTATNADGRTDRPLIAEQPIPIAQYELRFAVGTYFVRQQTPLADPPFLDVVPIRFAIAEPEGHYHLPLLVTPWSYSTYRGS
jgi:2-oxo-4-hydroxy-4-carboxy-5-ureidoimidazoline decarboxylase